MSSEQDLSTKKIIYLDINALYDLRLGTLAFISPEFASEMMQTPDYYKRAKDKFSSKLLGSLDEKLFYDVYDKYKNEILRNSLMTKIMNHVIVDVLSKKKLIGTIPVIKELTLEINIYPFNLTIEEQNAIVERIGFILGDINVPIIISNNPPSFYTLDLINERYLSIITYDAGFMEHLNYEFSNDKRMDECVVYLPMRIMPYKEIPDNIIKDFSSHNENFFTVQQNFATHFYFRLSYMPIAHFCANVEENKSSYITS